MLKAKLYSRHEQYGKYPRINVFLTTKTPICVECNKPIAKDTHIYVCADMNKIWHKDCMNDSHVKDKFENIAGLDHHYDYGCILKIVSQVTYDSIIEDEKTVNVDIKEDIISIEQDKETSTRKIVFKS